MRVLLLAVLVLFLTAAGVSWVLREPGYVLIAYGLTSVELSFTLFVLLLAAAFVIGHIALRALLRSWALPGQLNARWRARQVGGARRGLVRGLLELAEGRWSRAERLLIRSARHSETPLVHWLAAARAAQMQRAHERRDTYLSRAIETDPKAEVAVGLTQAELQLAHRQLEQALATLAQLSEQAPRHSYILRLLARTYRRLGDWERVLELLPRLRDADILAEDELRALEQEAVTARIEEAGTRRDLNMLRAVWDHLPRARRRDPTLLLAYVRALGELGDVETAAGLIRDALERDWDEAMAHAYGRLPFEKTAAALKQGELWLKEHGRSPMLLLTLGRLCRRARLWGKARIYFESSLGVRPLPETYGELAGLLEQMGDTEAAQQCYRKGLKLAVEHPRDVPEPMTAEPAPVAGLLTAVPGGRA